MTILFIVLALFVLIIFSPVSYVHIKGSSMYPTYEDGERVWCIKVPFSRINQGDVVIARTPTESRTIVIKRVLYKSDRGSSVFIVGDNSNNSNDSRHYGYVPKKNILGKVIPQRRKEYEI